MSDTPAGAVQLEPGDYWRFRARLADVDVAMLKAHIAVKDAERLRAAELAHLVAQYGVDPKATAFRWNDDTCEITATEQPNA